MKCKAILLDLDDTIVSGESISEVSWKSVCKEFAPQVDGLDKDKLYLAIRETGGWYWTDPIKHRRGRLDLKHAQREVVMIALTGLGINDSILAKEIADSYRNEREKASFLFPGATATLNQLRQWN